MVKVTAAVVLLIALVLPAAQAMASHHDDSCCCPLSKAKHCPMRGKQSSCGMRSAEAPVVVPLILREPAVIAPVDATTLPTATAQFEREVIAAPRRIALVPDSPPPRA